MAKGARGGIWIKKVEVGERERERENMTGGFGKLVGMGEGWDVVSSDWIIGYS